MTVIKPILKYPGAKWALAPWIVQYLPRMPHYVEPFCGSAAVFFNLPWKPKHAVLNDLSGDIVNLFRVIREHGDELAALVEMTPWAREEYEQSYEPTEDSLERARRFVVRVWQSHGQSPKNNKNGWKHTGYKDAGSNPVPQWRKLPESLRLICSSALLEAEIEHRPAIDVIQRSAEADVLLYVDPPYVTYTRKPGLYQHEMTDADHILLLDALDKHPGPVVLSGYRCELYDQRLAHWHSVTTQAQAEKGNTRTEVLWLNEKAASSQQLRMVF